MNIQAVTARGTCTCKVAFTTPASLSPFRHSTSGRGLLCLFLIFSSFPLSFFLLYVFTCNLSCFIVYSRSSFSSMSSPGPSYFSPILLFLILPFSSSYIPFSHSFPHSLPTPASIAHLLLLVFSIFFPSFDFFSVFIFSSSS